MTTYNHQEWQYLLPNPKNSKSKYKNNIIFVHNDKRVNKRETKPTVTNERTEYHNKSSKEQIIL